MFVSLPGYITPCQSAAELFTRLLSNHCVIWIFHHTHGFKTTKQICLEVAGATLPKSTLGLSLPNSASQRKEEKERPSPECTTASCVKVFKTTRPHLSPIQGPPYVHGKGRLPSGPSHSSSTHLHVGLDLPDELRIWTVKQGPDGGKRVQDNGLRVRINVFLEGKHTFLVREGRLMLKRVISRISSCSSSIHLLFSVLPPGLTSGWRHHLVSGHGSIHWPSLGSHDFD